MLRLRLRELYKERGVTQKEVSEGTGIRPSTLSGLARGIRASWDLVILERLMIYFDIEDVSEIIEYKKTEDVDSFLNDFKEQKDKYSGKKT